MRCLWLRRLQARRWNLFSPHFLLIPPARGGPIVNLKCLAASRWGFSTPVRVGEESAGRRSPEVPCGEVARALADRGMAVLVNHGPGEEALAEAVGNSSGGVAVPLKCSVGELIALTRRARLFIGGDTGPMQLAAALRVPVVALFGPTRPERNGPFGTPSVVLRSPQSVYNTTHTDRRDEGLVSIGPQAVIQAAERLLGEQHG